MAKKKRIFRLEWRVMVNSERGNGYFLKIWGTIYMGVNHGGTGGHVPPEFVLRGRQ